VGLWSSTQPGTKANVSHLGGWLLDLSAEDCASSGKELLGLLSRWHLAVADRYTQIVLIGVGLNEKELTASLDACLLTRAEMEECLELLEGDDDTEDGSDGDHEASKSNKAKPAAAATRPYRILEKVIAFSADPEMATCAMQP
jgi:hypothetical protein